MSETKDTTENKDNKFEVSNDDIQKAIDELTTSGAIDTDINKGGENDDKNAKTDTNAQVEGEDEGGDNKNNKDDKGKDKDKDDMYKAHKMNGKTYYRKMKKGKDDKMEYADDKKYKEMKKGEKMSYAEMSSKEITGMEEAGGGKDKYKGLEKAELVETVQELPNITIQKANEVSELEKAEDIIDFIVNYSEEDHAIVKAENEEEEDNKGENTNSGDDTNTEEMDENLEKALDVSPALKKFNDDLNVIQDHADKNSKNTGVILKGMIERLDALQTQVETMGKNVQPGKAVTDVTYKDRFGKDIVKAEGEKGDGILHVINDKLEILELMDTYTFQKGETVDDKMGSDMFMFESSGTLDKSAAMKLEKEYSVKIVI